MLRKKICFQASTKKSRKRLRVYTLPSVGRSPPPETLGKTNTHKGQWEVNRTDAYGPLPKGEDFLVVIDRYLRIPEVEIVRSTKASFAVPKLD